MLRNRQRLAEIKVGVIRGNPASVLYQLAPGEQLYAARSRGSWSQRNPVAGRTEGDVLDVVGRVVLRPRHRVRVAQRCVKVMVVMRERRVRAQVPAHVCEPGVPVVVQMVRFGIGARVIMSVVRVGVGTVKIDTYRRVPTIVVVPQQSILVVEKADVFVVPVGGVAGSEVATVVVLVRIRGEVAYGGAVVGYGARHYPVSVNRTRACLREQVLQVRYLGRG